MNKILTTTWAVVITVILLVGLKAYNPSSLQTLQLKTFDSYQTFGDRYDSSSIVLIDISDAALEKKGQWPWKRDQLGRIVVNAYKKGAALVVLQVVFTQKDRLGGDEMFLKMITKYPVILTETDTVTNLVSIERKALAIGNVEVPVDIDGTIRKLPLDKSIPKVVMETIKFPVPEQDTIWIDFRHRIPRIDYTDKDWSAVKGKIVFIGTTFKGSTFITTPNGLKNTHEAMAISTETLLSGKYISRPDWLPKVEWAFILFSCITFLLLLPRLGVLWSLAPLTVFAVILTGSSYYMFNTYLYLTSWVDLFIIGFLVWSHLIYNNFARENRLKLQIKKQFEHYLAPAMVRKLQKNPELLKLGGDTRKLTLLFCDIRGFTPISEQFKTNPQGLTELVNRFLTPMTDIIMLNEGTVDKYMGDCIMAFWNAPLDVNDQADKAVDTSIAMLHGLKELNTQLTKENKLPINIGIGLNTGDVVVGNMGSDQRFDYSCLGDAVNLAARLEGQTKGYGVKILFGEETVKNLGDKHTVLELDQIAVKGKTEPVAIYTVIDPDIVKLEELPALKNLVDLHVKLRENYVKQNWKFCEDAIDNLMGKFSGELDSYYIIIQDRIKGFKANPPAKNWDGVFVATTK